MKLGLKIGVWGILFLLFSCNKPQTQNQLKIQNNKPVLLLEKQKNRILGKQIKALNSILGDSIDISNKVVFLYNGFDCNTCIDIGYQMILELNKKKNDRNFIVATSANVAQDQIANGYENYVFYDEHDLIRKELKYIKTPVLLRFDDKARVCQVFFPNLESESLRIDFMRKSIW